MNLRNQAGMEALARLLDISYPRRLAGGGSTADSFL